MSADPSLCSIILFYGINYYTWDYLQELPVNMVQCDNVFLERVVRKNKSTLKTEEHAKKVEVFVSPRIAVLENMWDNTPSSSYPPVSHMVSPRLRLARRSEDVISLLNIILSYFDQINGAYIGLVLCTGESHKTFVIIN